MLIPLYKEAETRCYRCCLPCFIYSYIIYIINGYKCPVCLFRLSIALPHIYLFNSNNNGYKMRGYIDRGNFVVNLDC